MLFASSGITIECDAHVSRFLTSAGLVRALNNEENGHDNVKVSPAKHHLSCHLP